MTPETEPKTTPSPGHAERAYGELNPGLKRDKLPSVPLDYKRMVPHLGVEPSLLG